MTKAQLLSALSKLPDDANVLISAVATTNNPEVMVATAHTENAFVEGQGGGELSDILKVDLYDQDGPGAPPFAIIRHHLSYEC